MAKKVYTTEQLVERWEHTRAIENLMGKAVYYEIYRWCDKIWEECWTKKAPDPMLGFNNGWYKGSDAISEYYKKNKELAVLRTKLVYAANPEEFEGKTEEEVFGAGALDVSNLSTPIVEIAEDGLTAKGLWYNMRGITDYDATGIATFHDWGWLAADFVYEDGQWKIWHMVTATDLYWRAGETWTEPMKELPVLPEYAAINDFKLPEPNVPMEVYEKWHNRRVNVDYPGLPKPYATFAETFSYGI